MCTQVTIKSDIRSEVALWSYCVATMWKVLVLAVCVASFNVAIACHDCDTATSTTTKPPCGCENPPKCGKNEVYDDCCTKRCRPELCSELGFPLDCDKKCKPGCKCKDGYVRNKKGICIPIKDCPSCGGDENAESGCGTNCGKKCSDIGKKPPFICPLLCKLNGCDCRDGFFYDPNQKKCVKKEDCTPTCKENEVYSPCANGGCGPKNCSQIDDPHICIDPICIKGCVCKDGYLRDDATGKCIPKDKCPKPPKCGKYEFYDDCSIKRCRPELCSELGFPLHCEKKCKPGCKCKDGYVRNQKGICIPKKDCPSCGGDKNAESGCGTNCGKKCSDIGKKHHKCPLGCILNGCDCRDGYFYDPNQKKCVKKEDCTPTCTENEVYSSCINGGCGPKKCSDLNKPNVCVDPAECDCIKGCICKKGYLTAHNGTCIPKEKCPEYCPGPNEYYEPCIHNCESQNCSDRCKIHHCPNKKPGHCDSSGCRCKKGYLRNDKGICVLEKDCPHPKCPPGEVWDECPTVPCEGDYCPKTRDSPQTCPIGIVCDKPRCVCGYNRKRDKKGHCILIPDCPPFKCGKNEVYVPCPSNCPGEKCSDFTYPTKCSPHKIGIKVNCRPACKCKKDYYRDEKGNCIPSCECPPATTSTTTTTRKPTTPCD